MDDAAPTATETPVAAPPPPKPPPTSAASKKPEQWAAVILRQDHMWYAQVAVLNDRRFHVSDSDAWNFNIEIDLPVMVTIGRGPHARRCRITRRLRNNKQFKKI
jgi:hypothetical protein